MAKSDSKEAAYTRALQALGVYDPAFDGVIHSLCILERETARIRRAWCATTPKGVTPSPLDPHYAQIRANERDIQSMRDSLGLTPKGLRRLKAASIVPEATTAADARGGSQAVATLIDTLKAQAAANAVVQIGPPSEDAHA